jgi:hypothetical protein
MMRQGTGPSPGTVLAREAQRSQRRQVLIRLARDAIADSGEEEISGDRGDHHHRSARARMSLQIPLRREEGEMKHPFLHETVHE